MRGAQGSSGGVQRRERWRQWAQMAAAAAVAAAAQMPCCWQSHRPMTLWPSQRSRGWRRPIGQRWQC